jgi:hypothetical protein
MEFSMATIISGNFAVVHDSRHRSRWYRLMLLFSAVPLLLAGCTHITPQEQRLVSKPNMQFIGSNMFNNHNKLLSQFESSSASAVGGQGGSGSCSACGE